MSRETVFESLYRADGDPWRESSWYERRKRDLTIACLPRERYERAFEPGCGTGALTALLARRCDEVVASDVSGTALAATARRLEAETNVRLLELEVPERWPEGRFDLVVVSELAYFLRADEFDLVLRQARSSLCSGGDLVLVDWRGPIEGFYGLDAGTIHERARAEPGLTSVALHEEPEFLLEVFRA